MANSGMRMGSETGRRQARGPAALLIPWPIQLSKSSAVAYGTAALVHYVDRLYQLPDWFF
jgi:hypothetical protein